MVIERKQILVEEETFYFYEAGQGPSLVLFPGFAAEAKNLFRLVPLLENNFHLILMETPGFVEGKPLPIHEYRLDLQVKRLHACFQAMGLKHFAIGGNSSGGNLATAYGLSYPEEITHLILLAPQGIESNDFAPYSQKPKQIETIGEFDQMMADLYHHPAELSKKTKHHLIEKMKEKFTWLNQIREVIRNGPFAVLNKNLPSCNIPSLILWGKSDGRIPIAQGRIFAELLPKSKLYEMENVGHLLQIENPKEVAKLIIEFIGI